MKRAILVAACAAASVVLSGCATDPLALAQAVKILDEGCQRTVDLTLDKSQPGGGSVRVTRACQPSAPAAPNPAPETPAPAKP